MQRGHWRGACAAQGFQLRAALVQRACRHNALRHKGFQARVALVQGARRHGGRRRARSRRCCAWRCCARAASLPRSAMRLPGWAEACRPCSRARAFLCPDVLSGCCVVVVFSTPQWHKSRGDLGWTSTKLGRGPRFLGDVMDMIPVHPTLFQKMGLSLDLGLIYSFATF